MNTVEALRFAAEFLKSKEHHIYTNNGISWIALDRIGGAIRVLEAEANEREAGSGDRWWDSDNARWIYPGEE